MKAFSLQLSIAVCMILSITRLSAQTLQITCPSSEERPVTCIEDVPPQAGDSLGFLSYEGAAIENVTGNLMIEYSDFRDPNRGCPGNSQRVIRSFTFTDESDSEPIMCNIRYTVVQEENVDSIICDDVTVTLDSGGNATLSPEDVPITPVLQCPGDITISGIDQADFACNNILESPISNQLTAVTECNEEISCTFFVTVRDEQSPVITCPSNILIETDPCVCEAPVEFEDATASDNCMVTVTRTDTTGLNSGDLFPAGLTILTFQAEDTGGNTSSCNLQIRINSGDPGSIACKTDQNISLDQNCEAEITPSMVIKEANCDINSYRILLFDQQGNQLPSDTITGEYLGTVVTARAFYECFDNSCSLRFNVEDKIPPMMNCRDTVISCSEFIEFPLPEISDNCSTFEVVLLNQKLTDVSCDSATIDKIITRTYGIEDEDGNIMESCDQRVLIEKFDIEEVEGPELTVMVDCGSDYPVDENGNPDPSLTGAPSLNGIDLYPPSDLFCNVAISYDDMVFTGGNNCGRTLLRTWTVVNWYCAEDGMATFKQSITVIDTTGPVLIVPEDVTISSASSSCETSYTVPEPEMNDNCQSDLQLDIFYPGGVEFDTNSIEIELPLGENVIQYMLSDRCGNTTMESYTVIVKDNIEPVAICESGMSFSLDGNGMAILTAEAFDNGSLDACSEALLEIRRMESACGVDMDTLFGPSVTLCCADIGNDLMIVLQVTDDAGNANSCMTSIQVIDNVQPSFLTDLPDITVSNDFPVDTSDLSPFGFVEQNVDFPMEIIIDADSLAFSGNNVNAVVMDNCSVNTIIELKQADINMCQTGSIIRTFIVSDDFGTADTISQQITVIAQRVFTREDITFPNDTTITECNTNLDPDSLGSFPQYDESFNSMVAYTHEDDTTAYFSEGCFTLERVWYVADWCNRTDGSTFATYIDTQRIAVNDNEAPVITSACMDSTICSYDSDCGSVQVMLSAEGVDNCTSIDSLEWTYIIDYADERPDSIGNGNNFNGFLPPGDNQITWTLDDGCGNTDDCSYIITINNCVTPQPICLLGQEFFIESIDTSDNDDDDAVFVARVTASMLDADSKAFCGKAVNVAFSEDINDTLRYFDCDGLGNQQLELYAIDEDGLFDFCVASFTVSDTTSIMVCGMGLVKGVVFGNQVDYVKDVNVVLEGAGLQTMTDENGFFSFPEMVTGGHYKVRPTKQDRATNGVSTTDLVLIQRHILGIETFESPYKLLAADVNRSANVSASDIITIRKLLLGITNEFPGGKSWSFVPDNHIFLDPSDPWATPIPETHDIYYLSGQPETNFIGIKLGDVNESVRLREAALLAVEVKENKLIIKADQVLQFAGLFTELSLNNMDLKLLQIENHTSNLVENHHLDHQGKLRILFTDAFDESFEEGQTIFTLEFDGFLSDKVLEQLSFNTESAEVARENGETLSIEIRNEEREPVVTIGQNVPNPWSNMTIFDISVPDPEKAYLRIMDLSGKVVHQRTLDLSSGLNKVEIENRQLPVIGGMYIYEVSTSLGVFAKKMMLLRN
ncbi:HYR domain-containing protein [Portibacter marinus]|uniref:HYR domain-containing protein n=1 Tax=Portibacter marinus TaxID=2898660 RepID=UPI001F3FF623|nr:HYR domain-containing protein [Portibacter marinus]